MEQPRAWHVVLIIASGFALMGVVLNFEPRFAVASPLLAAAVATVPWCPCTAWLFSRRWYVVVTVTRDRLLLCETDAHASRWFDTVESINLRSVADIAQRSSIGGVVVALKIATGPVRRFLSESGASKLFPGHAKLLAMMGAMGPASSD